MQSRNTEIREILLGNFNSTGDKLRYEQNSAQIIWAMSMAILGTRLFGAVKQTRVYDCKGKSMKRVNVDCLKAFSDLGLLTELETEPELLTCYRRTWHSEPVMLTAEPDAEKQQLTICAYTRRALFSRISLWMILRKLEKELGGIEHLSRKKLKEEKKALKKTKKEEKKAGKKAAKNGNAKEEKAKEEKVEAENAKEEKGGVR